MTKSRQNGNVPNRLSVASRSILLTKTGTREGEVILQRDIGLLYTWTTTQGTDNAGTVVNVGAGSWLASFSGVVKTDWFGADKTGAAEAEVAFENADAASSDSTEVAVGTYLFNGVVDFTGKKFHSYGAVVLNGSNANKPTITNLVP